MTKPLPYLVTLKFDQQTFATLDDLRQTHFPPTRNIVPAHAMLFHDLPSDQQSHLFQDLRECVSSVAAIPLAFPALSFLGRGVAITIDAPELQRLRAQLATRWTHWLNAQDQQPYRPHVTIQNKVTADVARTLFTQLSPSWKPLTGTSEGLIVWRYEQGPWTRIAEFPFTSV